MARLHGPNHAAETEDQLEHQGPGIIRVGYLYPINTANKSLGVSVSDYLLHTTYQGTYKSPSSSTSSSSSLLKPFIFSLPYAQARLRWPICFLQSRGNNQPQSLGARTPLSPVSSLLFHPPRTTSMTCFPPHRNNLVFHT